MLIDSEKLLARLANDQYATGSEYVDNDARRRWNRAVQHVAEVIVPALVQEQRILNGLTELRRQTEWLASDLLEPQEGLL